MLLMYLHGGYFFKILTYPPFTPNLAPLSKASVWGMYLWYLPQWGPIAGTWSFPPFTLDHSPQSSTCPGHVSLVLSVWRSNSRNMNLSPVQSLPSPSLKHLSWACVSGTYRTDVTFPELELPTVKSKTCSPKSSNCLGHVSEVLTAWTCYKVEFHKSKVSFPEHTPFNCKFSPQSSNSLWHNTFVKLSSKCKLF